MTKKTRATVDQDQGGITGAPGAGLFDADAYRATPPPRPTFVVGIGTVLELAAAETPDAAVATVIARRFPVRGRGDYAARVLPPDPAEITVREITDAEEAAYASAETKCPAPVAPDAGRAPTEGISP